MNRKLWVGIGAGTLLVTTIGTSYFSPLWTMHRIHQAATQKEADRLPDYIDFPSLRENLKASAMAAVSRAIKKSDGADDQFAKFGVALATALVNPMVDALVSPVGLTSMITSGKPPDLENLATGKASTEEAPPSNFGIEYTAWDRVAVFRKDQRDSGHFILRRDGLWSWKLVAIEIAGIS